MYPIKEATLQAVISYLEHRPFREVAALLHLLQREVNAAQAGAELVAEDTIE